MMVHIKDAVMQGFNKILIRTVDTDMVVLAVAFVQQLAQRQRIELWIAFSVVERTSSISQLMRYVLHLAQKDHWLFPCSMLIQGVTPCLILSKSGRRLRGKCGRHMMNLLRPSMSCTMHLNKLMKRQRPLWNNSPFCFMTRQQVLLPSMKLERICSSTKGVKCQVYLQPRLLNSST